jgi:hypothetical protein
MDWMFRKTTHRRIRAPYAPKGQATSLADLRPGLPQKFNAGCLSAIVIIAPCPEHVNTFVPKNFFFLSKSPGTTRSGNSSDYLPIRHGVRDGPACQLDMRERAGTHKRQSLLRICRLGMAASSAVFDCYGDPASLARRLLTMIAAFRVGRRSMRQIRKEVRVYVGRSLVPIL